MASGDFKYLARRITSDKTLRDNAFNIAKDLKYDRYQRRLASTVYKFFDEKSADSGVANNKIKQKLRLAEKLHKPIIKNFKKKNSLFRIQRQYLGC